MRYFVDTVGRLQFSILVDFSLYTYFGIFVSMTKEYIV